ncbi:hypothetical protein ACET3Z_032549 [Daucus carota]
MTDRSNGVVILITLLNILVYKLRKLEEAQQTKLQELQTKLQEAQTKLQEVQETKIKELQTKLQEVETKLQEAEEAKLRELQTKLQEAQTKLLEADETKFQEAKQSIRLPLSVRQLCRRFTLKEIQWATNNFQEEFVIGRGGFGLVYKGIIDYKQGTVAIKRLKLLSKQGSKEFQTEIEMLSKFQHSHLVSLIGYCDDYEEMILVYDYMSRGTLADHLHKKVKKGDSCLPSLTWIQRLKICIGAAHGLDYLHTGTSTENRVIHRDVKSTNILLDENFAAKLSDFGLSKIGPANQTCTYVSTRVKGTPGYLDPYYVATHRLTRKTDVYAFGVVLFEVLCGRPALDMSRNEDQMNLAGWVQHCLQEGFLDKIIDPRLKWEISSDSLNTFVDIAVKCLHYQPKHRPTIAEVVVSLESALRCQVKSADYSLFEIMPIDYPQEEADCSVPEVKNTDHDKGYALTGIGTVNDPSAGHRNKQKLTFSERVSGIFSRTAQGLSGEGIANLSNVSHRKKKITLTKRIGGLLSVTARVFSVKRHAKTSMVPTSVIPTSMVPTPWNQDDVLKSSNLKSFAYNDLRIATRNFRPDSVLGEGGFGCVYKGWIDENTFAAETWGTGLAIAVKKLNIEGYQGYEAWLAEISCLGTLCHPNLVKLIGYCLEDERRFLVYEFMAHGSLDLHLFRRSANNQLLTWNLRMSIALGAAKGLAYLHSPEANVIHRDFKTSNILIDSNYEAKLSDFGMAKDGPDNERSHVSTRVMGTNGYVAPEYLATGHITMKSDVYSFGVVLLEILTGRRVNDRNRPKAEQDLVAWAKPHLHSKRKFSRVMDPQIEGQYPRKEAFQASCLVLACLSYDLKSRPDAKEVVEVLQKLQNSYNSERISGEALQKVQIHRHNIGEETLKSVAGTRAK